MRIFKLSKDDPDMANRKAVLKFFTHTLWRKSAFGRFGLTEDKAAMRGIERGTLILFTYETECLFMGIASGPIVAESGEFWVPLDMACLAPISGWLADFQQAAHKAGLTDKELVHTQAWPGTNDEHDGFVKQYFNYDGRQRVLFVRVGWMKHYQGPIAGDERPIGGGGYNKDKIGFEVCNFLPLNNRLYGYFQPQMRSDRTKLERIDLEAKNHGYLQDVTIVWVATRPHLSQVVVGWWKNATVYRDEGPIVSGRLNGFSRYRATASVDAAVLVPEADRIFEIPRGTDALGQSNVYYPLEDSGERRAHSWMFRARLYLEEYKRDHRVEDTIEQDAKAALTELENNEEERSGQGFRMNAEQRKAIEDYGMKLAIAHYGKDYHVQDVSKKRSYDLLCTREGVELHVEVKATTTAGKKVFLTHCEANLAASIEGNRALFIVHSIILKDMEATGGKIVRHEPWILNWEHTQATLYAYRPPAMSEAQVP